MSHERILLVEDERAQRDALTHYLSKQGFVVDPMASGEQAADALKAKSYSVMITDLRLPGIDGLEVVRRARALDEELGILLATAYASMESAIDALRAGAHDYLLKPLILEEVSRKVRSLIDRRDLLRENVQLRRALNALGNADLVATSPAMQKVVAWIRRAGSSSAAVLITGETGTGKEVVARAIHRTGPNAAQPFLAVNLAAMPDTMAESELFGHERGAFTGADRRRDGILRAAGTGTVFLDEIGELSLALQAKLLRVLESHEVRPLGSDTAVPFQARLLAATHRDLKSMIAAGTFREDLYYRLNVVQIELPPLRERQDDIPLLVQHLVMRHAGRSGVPIPTIAPEAIRALGAYGWRGNVRELSNVLERALILADNGRIDADTLPADVRQTAEERGLELIGAVERFERGHIAMVLRSCSGNRDRAAEILGISPATLYRRLEKLDLKGS